MAVSHSFRHWAVAAAFILVHCLAYTQAFSFRLEGQRDAQLFSRSAASDQFCLPTSSIPTAGVNLTAEEFKTLDYICWKDTPDVAISRLETEPRAGIPPGVACQPTTWCDSSGACSEVCKRGTVTVEPWLDNASRLQAQLARELPFCFSVLLGTHNSAITLADGYGNLDPAYQALFKYVKWAVADFSHAVLRTNNQWLSVTDQLNLGVRVVELDTHWIGGMLRIAHCGGLHVSALNTLVRALNTVAKLLGHDIQWDTEQMGCQPSLSSIPVFDQRTLRDALHEIREWMEQDENKDEFLVLFFDDQPNLAEWGVVEDLKNDILSVFPREIIFTQDDFASTGGYWPTAAQMVEAGRRLVLVSVSDYGEAMAPLIFPRGEMVCKWTEPPLRRVNGVPQCVLAGRRGIRQLFSGSIVRVGTCELEYGPLNCDFVWRGGNAPYLDEATLPELVDCGLNIPSPDLLTPSRAAAAVWTWAVGHPFQGAGECSLIDASDGRWLAVSCEEHDQEGDLPSVCRMDGELGRSTQWALGTGPRGSCPDGFTFDAPRHPQENYDLARILRKARRDGAWLPMTAPDWVVLSKPALAPSKRCI